MTRIFSSVLDANLTKLLLSFEALKICPVWFFEQKETQCCDGENRGLNVVGSALPVKMFSVHSYGCFSLLPMAFLVPLVSKFCCKVEMQRRLICYLQSRC